LPRLLHHQQFVTITVLQRVALVAGRAASVVLIVIIAEVADLRALAFAHVEALGAHLTVPVLVVAATARVA